MLQDAIAPYIGGKVSGRNFAVSPKTAARFDVTKPHPLLEAPHERLASVVIECLPWQDVIRRYDRAKTLFYLDPPYSVHFAAFAIEAVATTYTMAGNHKPKKVGELIVTGRRVDVIQLLPAATRTLDMRPDSPGTWMYHCHVNDHIKAGMMVTFHVNE